MSTIYIIKRAGEPVALADAAGQADAKRLYLESLEITASIASARDVLALRALPVLARGEAAAVRPELAIADLFEDRGTLLSPDELAEAPVVDASLGSADLPAEFLVYLDGEEVAAAPQGEPAPSAPSTGAPTVSPAPAAVELPDADEPTQAERMAGAYAAGVELGKQGALRWGKEFMAADDELTAGLSDEDGDAVHDELLRGFEFGRAAVEPKTTPPAARGAGKPVAKYRNTDGSTWTGRGLKPKWLVQAIEDGKTLEDFLIAKEAA